MVIRHLAFEDLGLLGDLLVDRGADIRHLDAGIIARALGASVRATGRPEIGYNPSTLTERAQGSPLRHLAGVPVLHWHDDQSTLPQDTDLLAATALTPHQAFAAGPHVLGLQFHL